jgi:hypothetical protein
MQKEQTRSNFSQNGNVLIEDGLQGFLRFMIMKDDIGAMLKERQGRITANVSSSASNQYNLATEPQIHVK